MISDTSNKGRIIVFDILKGIAIILVVINHVKWVRDLKFAPFFFRTTVAVAVPIFITITAYLYAKNADQIGIDNWYSRDHIKHMARRLLPASTVTIISSFIYDVGIRKTPFRALLRYTLLKGPFGPGGYYVFTLFQIIAVYPFFYHLAKSYPAISTAGIFLSNLLFELIPSEIVDPNWIYPIFFFRFSSLIFLGTILYFHYGMIKNSIIPIIGIIAYFYMQFLTEIGYRFTIIVRWRHGSQIFAGMLAFSVLFYSINKNDFFLKENCLNKVWGVFACIGKASYQIYLFQVFFFGYISNFVYAFLSNFYPGNAPMVLTNVIDTFIMIIICTVVGFFWFSLENLMNQLISRHLLRQS